MHCCGNLAEFSAYMSQSLICNVSVLLNVQKVSTTNRSSLTAPLPYDMTSFILRLLLCGVSGGDKVCNQPFIKTDNYHWWEKNSTELSPSLCQQAVMWGEHSRTVSVHNYVVALLCLYMVHPTMPIQHKPLSENIGNCQC